MFKTYGALSILIAAIFILFIWSLTRPSYKERPITNPIASAAVELASTYEWKYQEGYFPITYPGGDVPNGGVCTDVVVRVLRKVGIDLQQEIHEDMEFNFGQYPDNWDQSGPDPNIDHRRVPNIMKYLSRQGYEYFPHYTEWNTFEEGEIICWDLRNGKTHIGIHIGDGYIFHNIGPKAKIDKDFAEKYDVIGRYRIPFENDSNNNMP